MPTGGITYADSGVNLTAADQTIDLIKPLVRSTHGPEVPTGIGLFGGLFDATFLRTMEHPLLVASLDGVGTKTALAMRAGPQRLRSVGQDIVNHCVNDVAVQGARPLFFLDYIAVDRLVPHEAAAIVAGMADACRTVGCSLIGGETAEMPLLYAPGARDIAGCLVGVVEREKMIDGTAIRAGDVVLGLPSNGLHTNGYSLAMRLLEHFPAQSEELLGQSPIDALLVPHRCYWTEIQRSIQSLPVHGFAHITGGGIAGNLVRILPDDCAARIDAAAWPIPPLFRLLAEAGNMASDELFRVFNMGIGLTIVLPASALGIARSVLPDAHLIGQIIPAGAAGRRVVVERGGIMSTGTIENRETSQPILAEGKTKIIRSWPDDATLVVMEHKDTISAGDGARRNELPGKGAWSCQTMDGCFQLLERSGIPTHYVRKLTATTSLVRRCQMIPIEVVTRRIATGSYLKRHPVAEGTRFDPVVIEFFLKDDARHDPQITVAEMHAAGIATPAETDRLHDLAVATFSALETAWARQDVVLVDLKIECGRVLDATGRPLDNNIVVADIIDNDSWRIWPHGDKTRMLDKQIYRDMSEVTDPGLQRLAQRYAQVAEMTNAFTK